MNENTTTNTAIAEASDELFVDFSDLLETTDDDGGAVDVAEGVETDDTAEADQPEAEESGEKTETGDTAETGAEAKESDPTFALKHLDEVKTVGRDEVVSLAQKGMDYDRIREKLDAATTETTRLHELEAWVYLCRESRSRRRKSRGRQAESRAGSRTAEQEK